MTAALERIARALKYAENGMYDGVHHKDWALDQVVRALTGCPMVPKNAVDVNGNAYEFLAQGESEEYRAFVTANPGWDEGIAP